MVTVDNLDLIFIGTSFLFHLVLNLHFALRKWRFKTAIRYGPLVYALSIPASAVSLVLLRGGKSWSF